MQPGLPVFAIPTFAGAVLLFVVEPMFAKWLLPTLGGAPATWTACMLAFQVLLLAGYGYTHFCVRQTPRVQGALHAALLVGAAALVWHARRFGAPALLAVRDELAVPWLVASRIGIPYVLLASTAPLMQGWSARAADRSPYSLYALSNAGALVGLLAYPLVIEPRFDVSRQLYAWCVAFVAFAAVTIPACAVAARAPTTSVAQSSETPASATAWSERGSWLAYSFVPSALLLAATNHVTVDVSATPLLWVVPLGVYLASFVLAFSAAGRPLQGAALACFIFGAVGVGTNGFAQASASLVRQVSPTLLVLAAGSLLCHGELFRVRPSPRALTGYYFIIATGGALGGVFVSILAPILFTDYYELELSTLGVFVLLLFAARARATSPWPRLHRMGLFVGAGVAMPLLAASLVTRIAPSSRQGVLVERLRSFLGPLRVIDLPGCRILTHGRIQHGMQLIGDGERRTPTMYFGPGTGLSFVLDSSSTGRPRRIGVVGLGVGTIAAYGKPGDSLHFYELDPNVIDVAQRDFTFLRDSPARIDITAGDGRLSLASEPPQAFDVLVLDAFSSDAVPVHLLTTEAFSVYARHLADRGVLLANVSNRYLAVDRVVLASARSRGFTTAFVETPSNPNTHVTHVTWAIAARDPTVLAAIVAGTTTRNVPEPVVWTDARASVLEIVRGSPGVK